MSLCVGICQLDEFGYCIGCGRTQAEIEGGEPLPPDAEPGAAAESGAPAPHEPR